MLLRAVESGNAPTFKALLERGELVGDCVSSFPSVTPVCTSEITTGVRPDQHLIPGMNWYHRAEGRYVEYGSSFEATRTFGLFRSLYDTVYNLNMGHLNHETPNRLRAPRRRRLPHRLHAVSDLPRPDPPRGRARGAAQGGGQRGEVPPRGVGAGRALLRRALLVAKGRLQADARPPEHPRRLLRLRRPRPGRARPLRLPPLLPARQRLRLPPRRARGDRALDRDRRRRDARAGRGPRRDGPLPRAERGDRRRRPRAERRHRSAGARDGPRRALERAAARTRRSARRRSSPSGRAGAAPGSGSCARVAAARRSPVASAAGSSATSRASS